MRDVGLLDSAAHRPGAVLYGHEVYADVDRKAAALLDSLVGTGTFAADPMALDGPWIDYYLRRFTRYGVRQGHHEDDKVFTGSGLCIKSYAAAVTGLPVGEVQPDTLPLEWFGNVEHTHKAIDDAVGFANLLVELSRRVGT